ncbi:hypothetical protein PENSPDRAFT_672618, partial [Peniophora sp. CONT]
MASTTTTSGDSLTGGQLPTPGMSTPSGGKKCAGTGCSSKRPHRICGLCKSCCEKRQRVKAENHTCEGHGNLTSSTTRGNPDIPSSLNDHGEHTTLPTVSSSLPPPASSSQPTVRRTDFAKNISPVYQEVLAFNEASSQAGHRDAARQAAHEHAAKREFRILWYTENDKPPLPFEGLPLPNRHLFHPSDFSVIVDIVGARNCANSFWHYSIPDKRWAVRMGALSVRANDTIYMRSMGLSDKGCLMGFPAELLPFRGIQQPRPLPLASMRSFSMSSRITSVSSGKSKKRALSEHNHSPTKQPRRWDTSSFSARPQADISAYLGSRSSSPGSSIVDQDFFDLSSEPDLDIFLDSPSITRPPSSAASFRSSSPDLLIEDVAPHRSNSFVSNVKTHRHTVSNSPSPRTPPVPEVQLQSLAGAPPGQFPFRFSCDMERLFGDIERHISVKKGTQKAAFLAVLGVTEDTFKPSTFSEHYSVYRTARDDTDGKGLLKASVKQGRNKGGEWEAMIVTVLPKANGEGLKALLGAFGVVEIPCTLTTNQLKSKARFKALNKCLHDFDWGEICDKAGGAQSHKERALVEAVDGMQIRIDDASAQLTDDEGSGSEKSTQGSVPPAPPQSAR